jgi:hypothetical protein
MGLTHYADIYDLEDPQHALPRIFKDDDGGTRFRYYEGYGQRGCAEKALFMESINRDHTLWSEDISEDRCNHVVPSTPGLNRAEMRLEHLRAKKVAFSEESESGFIPTTAGDPIQASVEKIDANDRENRISWNFSKMLCDYCEKADGIESKSRFFRFGGAGQAWSKDPEMMKNFGPLFEHLTEMLKDESYKISLSDQTVKAYPRSHFMNLRRRYNDFMRTGSLLNVGATEFNPTHVISESGSNPNKPKLARSPGAPKICGVLKVELYDIPQKPTGPPPPRRPSASSKESSSLLCWVMKQEIDHKMGDLDKKMDLLIKMHGPAVEAEEVSG